MNLSRYLYRGPQSAVCLRVGDSADLLDVQLLPGKTVELPAEHEYTSVLLALKHLVPIPANAEVEAETKPAPKVPKATPVAASQTDQATGAKSDGS